MTKNEIVARWMGWEISVHNHNVIYVPDKNVKNRSIQVVDFHKDYNLLHEAWVKFRDLKFDGVQYFKHSALCFEICIKITHGTITEAFDELVRGIEWCNTLNKKV